MLSMSPPLFSPEQRKTLNPPKPKLKQKNLRSDGLEGTRDYRSLLDKASCESPAALARLLGVSRACVTRALDRLNEQKSNIRVERKQFSDLPDAIGLR